MRGMADCLRSDYSEYLGRPCTVLAILVVLPDGIEPSTSSLPMRCSTPELWQRREIRAGPFPSGLDLPAQA